MGKKFVVVAVAVIVLAVLMVTGDADAGGWELFRPEPGKWCVWRDGALSCACECGDACVPSAEIARVDPVTTPAPTGAPQPTVVVPRDVPPVAPTTVVGPPPVPPTPMAVPTVAPVPSREPTVVPVPVTATPTCYGWPPRGPGCNNGRGNGSEGDGTWNDECNGGRCSDKAVGD